MRRALLNFKSLRVGLLNAQGYFEAVSDVSFDIHGGETFCLVGESGSGKTVTAHSALRLIEDALYHRDSHITYRHDDILDLPEVSLRTLRGRRIAIIFQEPMTSLNPVMTVGQQIVEVLRIHTPHSRRTAQMKVIALLEQVGIPKPAEKFYAYPHELSGGMKQRVMIAMALATEPDILIADEPTTALDVTTQAQVLRILRDLQQSQSMGILMITHDMAIVKEMADTVGVMYAGQLVEVSPSKEFFEHPKHPYSQMLMRCLPSIDVRERVLQSIPGSIPDVHDMPHGCRFAARCPHVFEPCEKDIPPLYHHYESEVRCYLYSPENKMRTHELPVLSEMPVSRQAHPSDTPLLSVQHVNVRYPIKKGLFKRTVGYVNAVEDVSFDLYAGQTVAVVGESGSGKTSLANGIIQLTPHVSGTILFDGKPVTSQDITTFRRDMQIVFQDPFSSLNPRMIVHEILSEGLVAQNMMMEPSARKQRLLELLDLVGLPSSALNRYPHEFSGGQRQRISIARALAVNPKLLICDEPTSALDVSVQAQIINLLKQLQQTLGIAYLFISHNIAVVSYLADTVAVMHEGKLVEYGPAESVLRQPKHEYTRSLLDAVPQL